MNGIEWCKKNIKEPWKEFAISQKMFVRDGFLAVKKLNIPVAMSVVDSEPYFAVLRKILEFSFGENLKSIMNVVVENEKPIVVYYEPMKNGVIVDFQEYYPKGKKELEKLIKELEPGLIKQVDVRFADILYEKIKDKTTPEEKFLTFGLVLLYSLKKGYIKLIPECGAMSAVKKIADTVEIEGFEEDNSLIDIKIRNSPVSYRAKYKDAFVDVGNKLLKAEINLEKMAPFMESLAKSKDSNEAVSNFSKIAIQSLKDDALKISPSFGLWDYFKKKINGIDEDIFERYRFFISQCEKAGIIIDNVVLLIAFEAGYPKKIIISKKENKEPLEIWNEMSDKYGYIDTFGEVNNGEFKLYVPNLRVRDEKIKKTGIISKLKSIKFLIDLMPYFTYK
ncbi:MAG: hypothetical protein PHW96_01625 [Candidatus Nanoarchaeia archaeon]|nr:hypothetical protein [Candidatus Nanoarchaeia archaeon]